MAISHITPAPFPVQDGILFAMVPNHTRYAVTSDGRIWARVGRKEFSRHKRWNIWRELIPWKHRSGHLYCRFENERFQVHRLVLSLFDRPNEIGEECRHLDGNPTNNHISNLKWGTRSENIADKARHGTGNQGERHCHAKLTNAEVRMARQLNERHSREPKSKRCAKSNNGVTTFLSRWFGISVGQVGLMLRGKAYSDV